MTSPPAPERQGFRYEGLAHRDHRPFLTRRRVSALLARHGIDRRPTRVEEHPRAGRNRLFLVETADGRQWLAKQSLTFPHAEAWFYREAGRHHFAAPHCLLADVENDVVVIEYLSPATPLDRIARENLAAALECLPNLANALATLHGTLAEVSEVPVSPTAFPELDPIEVQFWLDLSPGARDLVAGLQRNPKLSGALRRALEGPGTLGLIHGDLKLDNILLHAGTPCLVDWECCGRGSIETDLGAVIGSFIMVWTDHWLDRIGSRGTSLDQILSACGHFLDIYAGRRHLDLDRDHLAAGVAAWIVGRTWVESTFSRRAVPSHAIRLLIAEDLISEPNLLFGGGS